MSSSLKEAGRRRYVVRLLWGAFVGPKGYVFGERQARTFATVGAAHKAMENNEQARPGYSVTPVTH